MPLSAADFAEFFAAVNDGHPPFAWQQRLVDHVLSSGRWPDVIGAPTGTGKSCVVDAHVFVNAIAGTGVTSVPRRLSVVVNRRALVDNQHEKAVRLAERLCQAESEPPIVSAVAKALAQRRATPGDPVRVVSLRGGAPRDRTWVDDPTVCTIVCATPDMWGSRLLFRGYGTPRHARPREAGLFAMDSVMVLDEAHLNRQLLHCARSIASSIEQRSTEIGVAGLQIVETTATPATSGGDLVAIGVDPHDSDSDTELAKRLRTPKPTSLAASDSWPRPTRGRPNRPSKAYVAFLADQVDELHVSHGLPAGGRTVGCLVNTVSTATAVASELRDRGRQVEIRVGPMRPWDLQRTLRDKPGLYSLAGDPDTDVLIATQTIEVGVDIDLGAAVTELASASALAQRAGRVNRIGRSGSTEFRVVTPPDTSPPADSPPYSADDLSAALAWLKRRAVDPLGVAPLALIEEPPPVEAARRTAFQTPTTIDAELWAQTSDALLSEPSLDLYLRDSLDKDPATYGLVVRADQPLEDASALGLLKAVPPQPVEAFPASLSELKELLRRILDDVGALSRAFLYRDGESTQLDDPGTPLRPGDVVVVDDSHAVATEGVVYWGGSDRVHAVPWTELDGIEAVFVRPSSLVAQGVTDRPDDAVYEQRWHELSAVLSPDRADEASAPMSSVELVIPGTFDGDEIPDWVVVRLSAIELVDEETRQVRSRSQRVLLDDHSRDVEMRARRICTAVGLTEPLADQMAAAGRHHDGGKADPRFQKLLHAGEKLLAKSGLSDRTRIQLARDASGLPTGWRHEQLSVIKAIEAGTDGDLVLRLVGTSHGRGRPWFPHASSVTIDPGLHAAAAELFDHGSWADVIESTHTSFGVWGCAYLESLLRAADGQVSKEGR